ncbi:MAG TPA: 4'-phosphopantetheinyl transferase superfamily protein [Vicinamibacterales bacterium]|nr:4'-phosphopantetheinyl transferase superfamily protein [Vicinamibacterales bacterium]
MEVLPFNAVHVDLVETANTAALDKLESYRPLLSHDENERMARLVFDRDRRAFLITRALVRTTLSRYAPVKPAEWKFIANVHGRPEILDRPSGVPDLRFNISHTDGLIACAVTIGREVGVDVEHVNRLVTHDVAGRFFAPNEVSDLRKLPEDEQRKVFFDYWTLKESYIKARGFGLALPLGDFAFKLNPPRPPEIAFEPSLEDDPRTWQFLQDWPTPQHRLGLAVRRDGNDLPVRMRFVVPLVPTKL